MQEGQAEGDGAVFEPGRRREPLPRIEQHKARFLRTSPAAVLPPGECSLDLEALPVGGEELDPDRLDLASIQPGAARGGRKLQRRERRFDVARDRVPGFTDLARLQADAPRLERTGRAFHIEPDRTDAVGKVEVVEDLPPAVARSLAH